MPISLRVRGSCRVEGLMVSTEWGKRDERGVFVWKGKEEGLSGPIEDDVMKILQ